MTYWGAPGAGGKFYKGSSADSAWNHDLLWKVRVEKEVNELNPDSQVQVIPDYTTGVSDRKWSQAELKMLKEGVRLHGAGNFDTILNNPHLRLRALNAGEDLAQCGLAARLPVGGHAWVVVGTWVVVRTGENRLRE